jgi:hypothetical protein
MARNPVPTTSADNIMAVNPDMKTARPGRWRNDHRRRRRWSDIDFNLIIGVRPSGDHNAAARADNHHKAQKT